MAEVKQTEEIESQLQSLISDKSNKNSGPRPARNGRKLNSNLIEEVEQNRLKVLLNTSEIYAEFCRDNYYQEAQKRQQRNRVNLPKKSKAQKYCKFDLFTDEMVGLNELDLCVISSNQDEDY